MVISVLRTDMGIKNGEKHFLNYLRSSVHILNILCMKFALNLDSFKDYVKQHEFCVLMQYSYIYTYNI